MEHRILKTRRGFTLIEILVVIGIIVFLMSVLGLATMRFLSGTRISATKALMVKVQRQMQSRIEALQRDDLYQTQRDYQGGVFLEGAAVDSAARRTDLAMPPATLAQRYPHVKAALSRKSLQRQYLPQTWAEARYLLSKAGKNAPASISPACESAEVLFFFLTDSSIKGYTPATQDTFSGNEVRDTDNNGFPELVDSWGRPLRFFRWPTRLIRPAGLTAVGPISTTDFNRAGTLIQGLPSNLTLAATTNHDPDDAFNVLTPGIGWCTLAEAGSVEAGGAGIFGSSPFPVHTLFTWHSPLVVSAGPDGDFGIYDTSDAAHLGRLCEPILTAAVGTPDHSNPPALNDNITTLNIKSGGN